MFLLLGFPQTSSKRLDELFQPRLHTAKHCRINHGVIQRLLHPC
jgi:hypothetical protein